MDHVSVQTSRKSWILVGIALLVLVAAYGPMLAVFFQQMWAQPQYQFFPFVILAVGWLFWSRWEEGVELAGSIKTPWVAKITATLAWLLLLAAIVFYNPWASVVSLFLLLAALCMVLARRKRVTYLWGIWGLLWLMLPLPLGMGGRVIFSLQLLSSKLSSWLLDILGVLHLMEGNTLQLTNKQLFVDEACSGIVSVLSVIACAVIYGVWRNRSPMHVATLAITGILWAIIMNVMRITIIATVLAWYGIDWSSGASHEILGLVLFLVLFGCILSTDVLLLRMTEPVANAWRDSFGSDLQWGGWVAQMWDRLVTFGAPRTIESEVNTSDSAEPSRAKTGTLWPTSLAGPVVLAISFGLLGVAQAGMLAWATSNPMQAGAGVANAKRLQRNAIPAKLAGTTCLGYKEERRDREDIFGEWSKTYEYVDESGNRYMVSCDFPFSQGWHELTICYSGAGWEIEQRQSKMEPPGSSGEEWAVVEALLSKPDRSQGFVIWAQFDEEGEPVSPPEQKWADQAWRLLVRRSPYVLTKQLFQIQVFTSASAQISEIQKQTSLELLLAARERFRALIIQRVENERVK